MSAGALAAAGTRLGERFLHRPNCSALPYGARIPAKKIALTFDDGPNPAVTPRLLDLFDRHSVRATFFLIGKFARACPELAREISERGHLLGNHTDTHANLFFQSRAGIRDELVRCQDAVSGATRVDPPLWMRPPYGYRNPLLDGEVRRAGMQGVVMWSRACRDWKPQPLERLIGRLARVAPPRGSRGDIVVLRMTATIARLAATGIM